jgi:sporulation protein YlmC with PRC-barrel domain
LDTDFRVGADVRCSDGPAGKLRQLVVDPAADSVTHLVVESQEHFGIPVLVPRDKVATADEDHVTLTCTQAELHLMDPFEEVMTPGAQIQPGIVGVASPSLFPAPGLGLTPMEGPAGPVSASAPMMPMIEEVVPQGEVVIGRDSAVQARDGDVGRVDDLVTDPGTGRMTHLVVRSGHLWAKHTFRLPASAVASVKEDTVHLRLTQAEVEAIANSDDEARE